MRIRLALVPLIAGGVLLAGCNSDSGSSSAPTDSSSSAVCEATQQYMQAGNEAIAGLPELQSENKKERDEALTKLTQEIEKQTVVLRDSVQGQLPEEVEKALDDLIASLKDAVKKGENTPDAKASEYQTTVSDYLVAECPDIFSPSASPAEPTQ
ncbi:MAG: hypothetical protein KDC39_08035 [Actinobacteria bacterium]|nr:hypothetical protein [Actinomycetota bacterium]